MNSYSNRKLPHKGKYPSTLLEEEKALWENYINLKGDEKDRAKEKIMDHYIPFIMKFSKHVASIESKKRGYSVEPIEFYGQVTIGLIDSIERYNPSKGAKFETFASPRIYGEIAEENRYGKGVRLSQEKYRKIQESKEKFRKENNRSPTEDEISELTGISGIEMKNIKKSLSLKQLNSLENIVKDHSPSESKIKPTLYSIKRYAKEDPLITCLKKDEKNHLIRKLSRAEKLLISLHYYQGMKLRDVNKVLGLSKSRTSQMHRSTIQRLKAQCIGQYKRKELI